MTLLFLLFQVGLLPTTFSYFQTLSRIQISQLKYFICEASCELQMIQFDFQIVLRDEKKNPQRSFDSEDRNIVTFFIFPHDSFHSFETIVNKQSLKLD